jgi:hypothetical protein
MFWISKVRFLEMKFLTIHLIKNQTQNNTYLNFVITNQKGRECLVGVTLQLKLQLWLAKVFCIILCFFLMTVINIKFS